MYNQYSKDTCNGEMYCTFIIYRTYHPLQYGYICKFTSFLQELVQLRNLPSLKLKQRIELGRTRLTTADSELDTCIRCSGTDIGSYIVRNDQHEIHMNRPKDQMHRAPHQTSYQPPVMAPVAQQNADSRVPRTIIPGIAPLQTNNEAHRNVRYSYTATPIEFQRPVFEQFSPADSMIEESPISPQGGQRMSFAERTPYPQVPAPTASHVQNGSTYHFQTAQEVHPAHRAPYVEVPPVQYLENRRNLHELPQSPGPLPIKMDDEPTSPGLAIIHQPERDERNNPNNATPTIVPDAHHPALVYSPESLSGPNAGFHEAHRPGQVPHPNATVMPHWKHGLCEVDTLCCTAIICPCIVYGKTQYRLSRKAKKQEPTDLLGYEPCNSSCGIMAIACGFQCEHMYTISRVSILTRVGILASLQRNSIRRQYKLEGGLGDDCVKGLCCCCCVIMQDEREVRDREELIRRHAGPAIGPYAAPGIMTYAPPPR